MAQFRLTIKFAADMKLKVLNNPRSVAKYIDDWAIDVFRIQRKKVAMVTHAKSYFTFLTLYKSVGGAKDIPNWIGVMVSHYIAKFGYIEASYEAQNILETKHFYCKTNNRKLLGHMNDFKNLATLMTDELDFEEINWEALSDKINQTPIKIKNSLYKNPSEILSNYLEGVSGNNGIIV